MHQATDAQMHAQVKLFVEWQLTSGQNSLLLAAAMPCDCWLLSQLPTAHYHTQFLMQQVADVQTPAQAMQVSDAQTHRQATLFELTNSSQVSSSGNLLSIGAKQPAASCYHALQLLVAVKACRLNNC